MTESPSNDSELVLDDPWFSASERPSAPPPESIDPELGDEWFAKGQPLSSRPPPADPGA
jgi:hypothetical protein